MIKEYLHKRTKITHGLINTYLKRRGRVYDDRKWWDESFYTAGVSDRQTISVKKGVVAAKYHYASVEMLILRHFNNNNNNPRNATVLDIGSGAGHWIDFYKSLGAARIVGIDVSLTATKHLNDKFAIDSAIEIYHGKTSELLSSIQGDIDIVNAIGVMFHIIDDVEWRNTIKEIGAKLNNGGIIVVGGHFGYLNGLNVQIDANGNINKRLRSKHQWVNELKKSGFRSIKLYRNYSYLWIKDPLPENNVLIATK